MQLSGRIAISLVAAFSACAIGAANQPSHPGSTAQSALAAEEEITTALRVSDVAALYRLLAPDWIVISSFGGRGTREVMVDGIKRGLFTRKTLEISNPRVRVYGDVALVTSHVKTSGQLLGKPFDVQECQTDVLVWRNGSWRSEVLHETKVDHTTNCASESGPTVQNALAAEQNIAKALLSNNIDAIGPLLADDWVVVSAVGSLATKPAFLDVIKSGDFSRASMRLSDPHVRLYGNVAVIVTTVHTSGTFMHKKFGVSEEQTDVLVWKDAGWKSVFTHETKNKLTT
jgi:ketosteroid isomerase-like protein